VHDELWAVLRRVNVLWADQGELGSLFPSEMTTPNAVRRCLRMATKEDEKSVEISKALLGHCRR